MSSNQDSTPVRKGEELDIAALENYLKPRLEPGDSNASLEVQQFPGGHSNLTYLLRLGPNEYVLRRPPIGPVAPTAHDMPREFKLLSHIHPQFNLAPKPVLLCEDPDVIGAPFYLMERRRGMIVRSTVPTLLEDNLALRKRLSESVVDTLVDLHNVDIHATGIIRLGKPVGFVRRQVHGWAERWKRSKTTELPEVDRIIAWLTDRLPADDAADVAIVHNDFKLDNVMLDEQQPSRVVAVLDWEMSTVGDPLIDVGLFIAYWTMKGSGESSSLRAITNGPGWLTREELIARYQRATGRDLSRIVFYETFARFKVAVVIQQIYFRYCKGQTRDERFRNFDQLVSALSSEALEVAKGSKL
jgi:aminoglycoside phosphotransferase (APT) family kinase protein